MKLNLSYFWHKKALLSFISILFIITIHNSATNQYHLPPDIFTNIASSLHTLISYGLGAIAVPLFFFISGFTFFRNYKPSLYAEKLKSRFRSLFIPYIIWNIFGLLVCLLFTYTPISNLVTGRETFVPTFGNILSGIFLYKYNYTFWFLYELIIFVILSPIFHLLLSRQWLGLLSLILFLLLPLVLPSFAGLNLHFIVFYFLGAFFGRYHLKLFTTPSKTKSIIISGLFFFSFLILQLLRVFNVIALPLIASQLILIILVLSLWFFSDLFIPRLKPHSIYQEVFPIYILHPYIIALITKIIYLLAPTLSWMELINEIFSPPLTILTTLFIVRFWHQKLPKSYRLLFGNI